MTVASETIPREVCNGRAFWLPWRYEKKPGAAKPTKVPKLWNRKGNASSTNPVTWTTFDNALQSAHARAYDGIGIALSDADPYCGVDLDDCIGDDGTISDSAREIVEHFASYTEVTPSGRGLRILVRGNFTGKGRKLGNHELYCRGRFVTITGNHLAGTPTTISENQSAIDWLYVKLGKPKPERPATATGADISEFDQDELADRAWRYIGKCPDAISGDDGHGKTYRAACECYRFGLDDEHAAEVMQRFNADKTGDEQWDGEELQHKLDDARREVEGAGEFGSRLAPAVVVLDRKAPLAIARKFLRDRYAHPEHPTLLCSDDDFHRFNGVHWEVIQTPAIRHDVYPYLEAHKVAAKLGDLPFNPTSRDVDGVVDALKSVTYSPLKPPAWTRDGGNLPDPAELIVAPNGVFKLTDTGAEKLCNATPRLFTVNALDYRFLVTASAPMRWLAFLADVFDDDQQQIELLQEWFGYVLTADTSLQKMLLLVGPPRSGKGTIARVLSHVVGAVNVCAPTLAGLGTNFGLWALIGKTLAIVSDARLSGRTDQAIVTERLLSISGEDALTIDRKNQKPLTMTLDTRIMLLTNELPRLADASGALANRFVILRLRKSYLGMEDTGLTDRLVLEVPSIAAWALEGLRRLRDERRFTQPADGDDLREELNDLASPISAFIRECCNVRPGAEAECGDMFAAWSAWCDGQGARAGTVQTFGRDLRAAIPSIDSRQPRIGDVRTRAYVGIALTEASAVSAQKWRSERSGTRSNGVHA